MSHFESFGRFEKRVSSVNELIKNKTNYSFDENDVLQLVPNEISDCDKFLMALLWRPKRKEWGWILKGNLKNSNYENFFIYDLSPDADFLNKELALNAAILTALKRSRVNLSIVKTKYYVFFNLGF